MAVKVIATNGEQVTHFSSFHSAANYFHLVYKNDISFNQALYRLYKKRVSRIGDYDITYPDVEAVLKEKYGEYHGNW
ncbi:MAG: hypothetical protein IJU79_02285 [Desulfovibrionaceae bacterium]|nr:hypothetical protein [Desulfovibrionaceae bacterium]